MNIKGFHIVFITIAVIFSIWLALFEYDTYAVSRNVSDLIVSIVSAIIGLVLGGYGVWFIQKIRRKVV